MLISVVKTIITYLFCQDNWRLDQKQFVCFVQRCASLSNVFTHSL